MASIRKRTWGEGGKSQTAWIVTYTDTKGERRQKTFDNKRAADAFRDSTGVEVRQGVHVADRDSITVSEAAKEWLTACETTGRRGRERVTSHTLRGYKQHVDAYIGPLVGHEKLNRLTGPRCQEFANSLLEQCSRATARKVLRSFKSTLIQARASGRMLTDPAAGISIGSNDRNKKPVEIPERADVTALLKKADELAVQPNKQHAQAWRRWRALIYTAALTGMRASELRGLTWDHVLLDEKTIQVRQRADEKGVIGPNKSKAGRRDILIPDALVTVLREWRLASGARGFAFGTRSGRPESLANVYSRCWTPLQIKAGIPHCGFHGLRHFHASQLIAGGASPKEVQVELGHANIAITMDTYVSLFKEDDGARRRRAEKLAAELI